MTAQPICKKPDEESVSMDDATLEIMQILRLHDGEATTGTIRDEHSTLDKNQTVQYRIDKKLRACGLVNTRKEDHPQYPMGVNTHFLTSDGVAWLDTNNGVLDDVRSNAEAVEKLNEVSDVTARLYQRVDDVEDAVDRLDNRERSHNTKRKNRINMVEDQLRKENEALREQNRKLQKKVTELEKQFWTVKKLLEESDAVGDPDEKYAEEWG
ncbi:hypothetical protein ACFOZ7_22320 [Natribaculum luteum]|uniref:Uncharacterized protein n=1 Tax=Natribaculum luteum TaxID=1586232 RepID=A0ABD5P6T5_9EURY|nr:hypothetical protein [Natribaculum luteum]